MTEDKQPDPFAGLSEKESKLLKEAMANPVSTTKVDDDKLSAREIGTDFEGNLWEFQQLFRWIFTGPDQKVLIENADSSNFTGVIHIKDSVLDPKTYPNSEQVFHFEEGELKSTK